MAITLDQARARIWDTVICRTPGTPTAREGIITMVGKRSVFVRYAGGPGYGVATDPDGLEFLAPEVTP